LLEGTLLTPIDIRILVTLAQSKNGSLQTEEILEQTGIAMSTWSSKQGKLVSMGLVEKHFVRVMGDDHVLKRMNYALTEKGKLVGQSLVNVTNLLSPDRDTPNSKINSPRIQSLQERNQPADDFQEKIGECIEVALDSFGSKLIELVKRSMEVEHGVVWETLPDRTQDLESVLRDYFGVEASNGLRKLIAANIRARFDLEDESNEDLSLLIREARQKNAKFYAVSLGTLSNEADPR
jgi:predicted transcriptional regulator